MPRTFGHRGSVVLWPNRGPLPLLLFMKQNKGLLTWFIFVPSFLKSGFVCFTVFLVASSPSKKPSSCAHPASSVVIYLVTTICCIRHHRSPPDYSTLVRCIHWRHPLITYLFNMWPRSHVSCRPAKADTDLNVHCASWTYPNSPVRHPCTIDCKSRSHYIALSTKDHMVEPPRLIAINRGSWPP